MARRLTRIDTREVSLVDRAANRRKFALLKAEEAEGGSDMEILDEALTEILDSPLEGEEALLKAAGLEDEDEEVKKKARAMLRLAGDDDKFKDIVKRLAAVAGFGNPEEPEKGKKKARKPDEDEEEEAKKRRLLKAAAEPDLSDYEPLLKADPALRPQIVLLAKAAEKDAVAQSALVVFKAQAERIAKAEKRAADAEQARAHGEALRKAEKFSALPASSADIADAMLAMEAAPGQVEVITKADDGKETHEKLSRGAWFERLLKSANAACEAANEILLKSSGSDRPMPGSALERLNVMAEQIVAKAGTEKPLTREQAFAKAVKQNPALFKQYETERVRGRVN